MDLESQPAVPASTGDVALGMPRILRDLADGNLAADEAATVASWLAAALGEELPAWVVERVVSIARSTGRALAG
jgi:hypothetical protein